MIKEFKSVMEKKSKMIDLGHMKYFLDLQVKLLAN